MSVPNLPMDLVDFLRGKAQPQLTTEGYGTLNLIPLEQLRVEQQLVTPTLSDFAAEDPHEGQGGYEVPAVNLISGGTSDMGKWYAWLFLWLPNERRYGSMDLDHGDLILFPEGASWSQIAADPEAFIQASESCGTEEIPIEYLKPWPRYPRVEA